MSRPRTLLVVLAIAAVGVSSLFMYEFLFVHRYVIAIEKGSYSDNDGLLEIGTTKSDVRRWRGEPDNIAQYDSGPPGFPSRYEEWSYRSWDRSEIFAVFDANGDTVIRLLCHKNLHSSPERGWFF